MNGSVLGNRYRLEARIGSGGMAEVYRGLDPVLNRTVAIKTLLPQYARDSGFVQRFRREAQAAARLNHPNIVGVYDSGSDDSTHWIVMEFVEGRTLADFLASGRKPGPMQAADIAGRIAEALSAAHAQGVIHRDVKPGNVMVTRDGVVKVMDFGIARMTGSDATAPQTSAVMGTASYLSPEQAQGGPVDARSDIYSLGVVIYELLAGRPPFTGESPVAIAWKQVNENPVPPSSINHDVPPALDAVVMKALSKNPANRYQAAEELAQDLERLRRGEPVGATPLLTDAAGTEATQVIARPQHTQVLPPQVSPTGSGRKVWLGVLIGILVVAVLGGGGYLLARSLSDEDAPVLVGVPDLSGLTRVQAEERLAAEGLKLGTIERRETDDETLWNRVIEQDPAAFGRAEEGSEVDLVIGRPEQTLVPDLSDLTVDEAESTLEAVNLVLGDSSQTTPSADVEEGSVVSQNPTFNTAVPIGTAVDVVLSSGPEIVVIPSDIICRGPAAVMAELADLGLNPVQGGSVSDSPCSSPGRVAASDPAPGTQVETGTTVTIFTGESSTSDSPSP
jgi:eukaryotic-like serine/threonine-protein kinase